MKYNEIKKYAETKNIRISDIADAVEMTSTGFKRSIEMESFPIGKVRDLCDILQIGVAEFFGELGTDAKPVPVMAEGLEAELRARIAELKQDKAYLQARLAEALAALNDGKKQRIA